MRRGLASSLFLLALCFGCSESGTERGDAAEADGGATLDGAPPGDAAPGPDGAERDAGPEDASSPPDGADDAAAADAFEPDGDLADASVALDAEGASDAEVADGGSSDASPLGTSGHPAPSCKALLAAEPATPDGLYFIDPTVGTSTDAREVFCDMSTSGGGWTAIDTFDAARVDLLRGSSGRELFKCTNAGPEHIISPPFSEAWTWSGDPARKLGGTWTVNGQDQSCSTHPEYDDVLCASRFGFACGNGPGNTNKIFPGVLDTPAAGTCADRTSAHTNGAFSICGSNNYRSYAVFIRSEDPAPTCANGRQDGTESDVDCGGALCAPCTVCGRCERASDCASPYTCDQGTCRYRVEAAIDWLNHCTTTSAQVLYTLNLPAGDYRITAIESAVTVWSGGYAPPTSGWYYQIPCSGLDPNVARLSTPAFYATPEAAWMAMTSTTATTSFAGGVSNCTVYDSVCGDNRGVLRFRAESHCP